MANGLKAIVYRTLPYSCTRVLVKNGYGGFRIGDTKYQLLGSGGLQKSPRPREPRQESDVTNARLHSPDESKISWPPVKLNTRPSGRCGSLIDGWVAILDRIQPSRFG